MTFLKDLLEVQVGKESVWGTIVTPTAKLAGVTDISIMPIIEAETVPEMRGTLAPAYQSKILRTGAEGSIEGVVLYEDMPYFFDSLFGEATPASGGVYVYNYSYEAPLGSVPASPRMFSLGYGETNSVNDYIAAGMICTSLSISAESNGMFEFTTGLLGKSVTVSGIPSGLADRSTNVVIGCDADLYIDAAGGTIGNTAVATTAFSFELDINTNRSLLYHLGDCAPSAVRDAKWEGSLALTLELTDTSKVYLADVLAATSPLKKLIRIKASSGTNVLQIDFSGVLLQAPEIFTDEDGVVTVELNFTGEVDTASFDNWLKILVSNSVATLA